MTQDSLDFQPDAAAAGEVQVEQSRLRADREQHHQALAVAGMEAAAPDRRHAVEAQAGELPLEALSRCGPPRRRAGAACTWMVAPTGPSPGPGRKRFAKTVSVIIAAPSAIVIAAIICACRSVGKPGKGSVMTSTPASRPSRRRT